MKAAKFHFFVPGVARTSGSKKFMGHTKAGKPIMAPAGEYQKPWQHAVAWMFMQEFGRPVMLEGAVRMKCVFIFQRPKNHYRTKDGCQTSQLKPGRAIFHITTPDAGKLRRAVEDSLSGLAYRDDSQVCQGSDEKRYTCAETPNPGVYITISEIIEGG